MANRYQAELAAQAGVEAAVAKIYGAIAHPDSAGTAFTTWAFFPTANPTNYYVAITRGAPTNLSQTSYLTSNNTKWLISDNILRDSTSAVVVSNQAMPNLVETLDANSKINLNQNKRVTGGDANLFAPWEEYSRKNNGGFIEVWRYAYWVDDESSRLDVRVVGNRNAPNSGHLKDLGASVSEIPLLNITNSQEMSVLENQRDTILTDKTAALLFSGVPQSSIVSNSWLLTSQNNGYDLIQYGATNGNRARKGAPKFNLNWSSLTNSTLPIQTRVNYIADFIDAGNTNYLANVKFGASGGNATALTKRRIKETISASIIDFQDIDLVPSQPENLMGPGNTNSPAPPVRLMNTAETPEPRFFGVDTSPVINEIMIVWNANSSNTTANATVLRSGSGPYTYTIPIAWRFELWNMMDSPIPSRNYKIRGTYLQQITSSAFGFGADAIPPETEKIFDLGNHSFSPGEIKVITSREDFTSTGPNDIGATWSSFVTANQPDGHDRAAYILFDGASSKWLSSSTYIKGFEAPVDGVNVTGVGSAGSGAGNRINDPRTQPLRSFSSEIAGITVLSFDDQRDNQSAKPGSIGFINNNIPISDGRFNYQNMDFWFDRPFMSSGNASSAILSISDIKNSAFTSIGELGKIWDPSWVHPRPQGADGNTDNIVAYRGSLIPLFKGGASLRVGQPDGNTNYHANSWALMDLFGVSTNSVSSNAPPKWIGKINVNIPKVGNGFTNTDLIFRLPALQTATPALGSATNIDTRFIYEAMKNRLGYPAVVNWSNAQPFYSLGELSELAAWTNTSLYMPPASFLRLPSSGTGPTLDKLNLADRTREEIFRRACNLLTTKGYSFRIYSIGQYLTAPISNPTNLRVVSSTFVEHSVTMPMQENSTTGIYTNAPPIKSKLNTQ